MKDKLVTFADDCMMTVRSKDIETLKSKITENFQKVKEYTDSNKLKINSSKSHFMIITTGQKRSHNDLDGSIRFGEDWVNPSSYERCLGVQVSETLCNWKFQIHEGTEAVIVKAGRKLHALRKLTPYLSFRRRLISGKAIVLSTLLYGCELWGPALTSRQSSVLQAAQNKLARWINQSYGSQSQTTDEDRTMCGFLTIHQMIVFRILCFGLSVLRTEKPVNIFNNLTGVDNLPHGIRRSKRVKEVLPSKNYTQSRSFKNYFLTHYKSLPEEMKNTDPRRKSQKDALKEWIRNNVQKFNEKEFI